MYAGVGSFSFFVNNPLLVMANFLYQDHVAKEKALQTMSSMSSAQIVSATSAMHSKSAGLNLGLTHNPVSYPGAVSLAATAAASIYYGCSASFVRGYGSLGVAYNITCFFLFSFSIPT